MIYSETGGTAIQPFLAGAGLTVATTVTPPPPGADMRHAVATLVLLLFPTVCPAQLAPADPEERSCAAGATSLLIIGTYHMANPGQDAVNLEADDPTSARRQSELGELLDRLARYQPTQVAIEATYGRSPWLARYRDWLAGNYQPGKNEIELVGFPLARRAGLPEVSAVDFPMWMDGRIPDEIDYDWKPPVPAAGKPTAAEPNPEQDLLRRSTVVEYIQHLNSAEYMLKDHAGYMSLLRADTTSNAPFTQSNTLLNWYKRNFRIFTNLYRISRPGGKRILLLIGSGHLSILRQLAIDSADFCLVDTGVLLGST